MQKLDLSQGQKCDGIPNAAPLDGKSRPTSPLSSTVPLLLSPCLSFLIEGVGDEWAPLANLLPEVTTSISLLDGAT